MKVFNERETAEILKTAAEKSHESAVGESLGLTINELEHIAKEAGIDPSEVNKAVEAIELKRQPTDQSLWGGPFSFSEQVQLNHEISAAEWENMLVPIRKFFQSKGDVSTREAVHEWSSPRGTTNSAHITALKEKGKTTISIVWSGPLTALPFYLPIPLVGIASLPFASEFLGLGSVPGLSFVALSIGLSFVTGRWALRRHMSRGFAKLRKLAATLQGDAKTVHERRGVSIDQLGSIPIELSAPEPSLELQMDDTTLGSVEASEIERSKRQRS